MRIKSLNNTFYTNYSKFYELHEFLFLQLLLYNLKTEFVEFIVQKIRVIRKIRHNSCKIWLFKPLIRIFISIQLRKRPPQYPAP